MVRSRERVVRELRVASPTTAMSVTATSNIMTKTTIPGVWNL